MYCYHFRNILPVICSVLAMLAAAGCHLPTMAAAQSEHPGGGALTSQQLMVKFAPGVVRCDAAGIARIALETGTSLEYVRPMSGGACVVRQWGESGDDLLRGQAQLRQHPDVEWLERDAIKKAL